MGSDKPHKGAGGFRRQVKSAQGPRKNFMKKELLVLDGLEDMSKPKRISNVTFGILGGHEMVQYSEHQVYSSRLYDLQSRAAVKWGALDPRLGVSDKHSECETCGKKLADCTGHFGYVKLVLPVFHIGYFKAIHTILQCICKSCSRVLLSGEERKKYMRIMQSKNLDSIQKQAYQKVVVDRCKRVKICKWCGGINGTVKKVTGAESLKLIHEKYKVKSSSLDNTELEKRREKFTTAMEYNQDLVNHIEKIPDPLNPRVVLDLFQKVKQADLPLLWLDSALSRPEKMILTHIMVPPVALRPSVKIDVGAGSNEDDLTMKIRDIVHVNSSLRDAMNAGAKVESIAEAWNYLTLEVSKYINGELPGFPPSTRKDKQIRGLVQRLKGKQGRFRGNLSGKRVDFSARTVISPDPNLSVDQVGVPVEMATRLTYPEIVNDINIERLREMVRRGPKNHPGANYVRLNNSPFDSRIDSNKDKDNPRFLQSLPQQSNTMVKALAFGDRDKVAEELEVGDVVERHVMDGDVVLFNRQPSLHKMSIMCHKAKVLQGRTLRFNECVCAPYNADFDGDEMNLHVPQTEEARSEAKMLMGVQNNLITPRNGEPMVSATQDFITASFLLTQRDIFFSRDEFCQILSTIGDCKDHIKIPPPAILKPRKLWTGKQVWGVLLRPNSDSQWASIDFEAKERNYNGNDEDGCVMCPNEGYVVFRRSELMCGNLGKGVLGESKSGLFYVLIQDHSSHSAVQAMNRMTKVVTRWLSNQGFTIGIDDVTPSEELLRLKGEVIQRGYEECNNNIEKFQMGTLIARPGCNLEESLESEVSGILSRVRDSAGKMCMSTLPRHNKPFIMATCGSKGSALNICQMVSCVGQQIVGGKRMPDGFVRRSLPHFSLDAKEPAAKGFVANSFYSGLTAPEFFFHTMGGREGLVDTAVKTAETGYMARRLMKALEDLSVRYDGSVRNSTNGVVQFTYGDDGLNPSNMEKGDRPVEWNRLLSHVKSTFPCLNENALSGNGIRAFVKENLQTVNDILKLADMTPVAKRDEGMEYFAEELRNCMISVAKEHDRICTEVGIIGYVKHCGHIMRLSSSSEISENTKSIINAHGDFNSYRASEPFKPQTVPYIKNGLILINNTCRTTKQQLITLTKMAVAKFQRAITEPGEAVGAIGAQSLGEPGTQMTLKTFHFAGVASMNVTLGVPRIKEIINASKIISTPIITAPLEKNDDERVARIVKGRIEATRLGQVSKYIEEQFCSSQVVLIVQLDTKTIENLHLDITPESVVTAILKEKSLKLKPSEIKPIRHKNQVQILVPLKGGRSIRTKTKESSVDFSAKAGMVGAPMSARSSGIVEKKTVYLDCQSIKACLSNVKVCGIDTVHRAVVNIDEDCKDNKNSYHLLVEGLGLLDVMGTPGVNASATKTNHIMETEKVLGIEAARRLVMDEVAYIFGRYGLSIDRRHLLLLADVMSYRGMILGITRFGISKMKESVLMLASFEKTSDHLFDAAVHGRSDEINGVSECIIMGAPIPIGTGMFKVLTNWKSKPISTTNTEDTVKDIQVKEEKLEPPLYTKTLLS